jgi:hypothetical protein
MNDPRATLRWRLAAIFGPELVALAISLILVVVVGLAVLLGGADQHAPPGSTPSPSPVTSELGVRTLTAWR